MQKTAFGNRKTRGSGKQAKPTQKDSRTRKVAKRKPSIVRSDVGATGMWDAVRRLFAK